MDERVDEAGSADTKNTYRPWKTLPNWLRRGLSVRSEENINMVLIDRMVGCVCIRGIGPSSCAGMQVLLSSLWLAGQLGPTQAPFCAGDCPGRRLAAPRGGAPPNALAGGGPMVPLFQCAGPSLVGGGQHLGYNIR